MSWNATRRGRAKRPAWAIRRERDPYTRAVGLVVSHGIGTHVSLSLWWFTVSYHRRDRDLEALIARAAERDRA